MKTLLFLTLLTMSGFCSSANEMSTWPYPDDEPKKKSLSIGLASDRPIDISRFLLARGAKKAKINGDGTYVAYTSDKTGNRQVWIKSIITKQEKQLTYGNGISDFYWHPDGQRILYASDNNGDEKEAYLLINVSGLIEEVVLPHSEAYRTFGAFNKDGTLFSYASTERNGLDYDVYVYDFKKDVSTLVYQAEFGFHPDKWQPSSTNLVMYQQRGEDASNLYLLNAETKKSHILFKPEIAADFNSINWKQDGSGFYFSSNLNSQMNQVLFYDNQQTTTQMIASGDWNLTNVSLCSNDNYLVWTKNNNGFDQLTVLDIKANKRTQVPLQQGVYTLSCNDNTNLMTVLVSAPNSPGTVHLLDLAKLKTELLVPAEMAGINAAELHSPEVVKFKARDNVPLQGLLYFPTNIPEDELPPIVIDVHGGPTGQAKPNWQPLTQYLVGQGIAVIDINVRGSTGFGKDFARLDDKEKRLDSVRDLIDTLVFLKKDNRVDADNAAVMGASYGGYMVNAVMGAYPGAFKAGASFVGVSNWVRALETASPWLKASDLIEFGDIREKKWQDFYAKNSPINTADKITSPMFYQHGVNDPRDPITESDNIVQVLRNNKIPVKYLRFEDEGHWIVKVPNKVLFSQELAKFLEQHLK